MMHIDLSDVWTLLVVALLLLEWASDAWDSYRGGDGGTSRDLPASHPDRTPDPRARRA